jgi:sulfonate transport system permease protein
MTETLTRSGETRGRTAPVLAPPQTIRARRQPRWLDLALRAAVPLGALGLWWLASNVGWIKPQILPAPQSVASAFLGLFGDGQLAANLSVSLARAAAGLAIGLAVALPLGVASGLYKLGDQLIDPTLQMIRTVPFLAVSPLLVVWLGIGEQQKIALVALACAIPFYLNTYGGVRQADSAIVEAARVFGASRAERTRRGILPSALPQMLIGLRQSIGVSMLALILAEQTNAPKGLGALTLAAQQFFQTDILLVCVAVYAIWGLVGDAIVRALEVVLIPWNPPRSSVR